MYIVHVDGEMGTRVRFHIDVSIVIRGKICCPSAVATTASQTPRRRGYLLNKVAHPMVFLIYIVFARPINAALSPFT